MGSESIAHEAIDSEPRELVKNIEKKNFLASYARLKSFSAAKKPALFAASGL